MFKRNEEVDFFELFVKSGDFAIEASKKLLDLTKDFSKVEEKVIAIKDIEHKADEHAHKIYQELHKAFITPIEREDILSLNHYLDNVIDNIEHISKLFYMFDVKTLEKDLFPFVSLVVKICLSLKSALVELKDFKKSKELVDKIIEVNTIEEEGDLLFKEAVRRLFISSKDPIHIMKWFEIYKELEDCLDECENVTNIIEDVILKNS